MHTTVNLLLLTPILSTINVSRDWNLIVHMSLATNFILLSLSCCQKQLSSPNGIFKVHLAVLFWYLPPYIWMICTFCYLLTSPICFSFMLAVDGALSYSWPVYLLPNTLSQLADKLIFHCYCYIHRKCCYWAKKCTTTLFPVSNNCSVVLLGNNCLILLLSMFCENLSVFALSQGF